MQPIRSRSAVRTILALLLPLAAAACATDLPTEDAQDSTLQAARVEAGGDVVPGAFIVTLRTGASPEAVAAAHGVSPRYVYRTALNGFAGAMSEAARSGLMRDARVARIEPDRYVHAHATTQSNATWGLDRIDQRALPLSGSYTYATDAANVHAYILDTGILLTHSQFTGRVGNGFDAVTANGTANDCNGHGTHVAGTVGGTTWGVAKKVTLHPVRVLDCGGSGTWSGVIAGINWVASSHMKPAVANMSLGGGGSASVDEAVNNAIGAGVTFVVSAGNGNFIGRQDDACKYSPARVPAALTIGATNNTDTKASWSNYGNCVDFFAPGVSITSAWHTTNTATNTISGTSMSAPHVTGAAALYLAGNASASPAQVGDALYAATTKGIVKSSSTVKNHLLYSIFDGSTGGEDPPVEEPPAGGITLTASGYKVKGAQQVDLEWSGAAGTNVDVFRDGAKLITTANDGSHTDAIGAKGGGSYVYRVCEAGKATCSADRTVTF